MALSKPDRVSVEEVLKLVDQLSPKGQEYLAEEIKLRWLRREICKAEESLQRDELIDGEDVFSQMKERNSQFRDKGKRNG